MRKNLKEKFKQKWHNKKIYKNSIKKMNNLMKLNINK